MGRRGLPRRWPLSRTLNGERNLAVGSKKNISSPSASSLIEAWAARPLPAPSVRSGPEKLPEVPHSVRLASQQGLCLDTGRCQEPHRRYGKAT